MEKGRPRPQLRVGRLRPPLLLVPVVATVVLLGWLAGWTGGQPGNVAHLTGVPLTGGREAAAPAAMGVGLPPVVREAAPATTPAGPARRSALSAPRAPVSGVRPVTRLGPAARPRTAPSTGIAQPSRTGGPPPTTVPAPAFPPVAAGPAPAPARVRAVPTPPVSSCVTAIANVESRGLYPAPGFSVTCPGDALGHEGMTCYNVAGICPGIQEIVIADPQPFVFANEFENSRIFLGLPVRCHTLDCGHAAYGY